VEPGWIAGTAGAGTFYPWALAALLAWIVLRALVRRRIGGARWESAVAIGERVLLTVLILGMVGGAMLQIVLRNVFQTGLIWIDPLLRHLVLALGFAGAIVATGKLRHIHMDVLARLLPAPVERAVTRFTALVAATVSLVLARAAWVFMGQEQDFGTTSFLGLPVWLLAGVIFLGFALCAVRFVDRALAPNAELDRLAAEREGRLSDMQAETTA